MKRVSPKWIHTNHSLLARSKRCVSCSFPLSSLCILILCLLVLQAFLLFSRRFFSSITHFRIVTNVCFMSYLDTSSLLSASRLVSTVPDVIMPCARRGGKAKASAARADPNA